MDMKEISHYLNTRFQAIELKIRTSHALVMAQMKLRYPGRDISVMFEDSQEESSGRGHWSGRLDCLMTLIGSKVGLGNFWRFPSHMYRHGGGSYITAYGISAFFLSLPICILELGLAQFCSKSSTQCWGYSRIFRGLGVSMCLLAIMITVYYHAILAWVIYFFVLTFSSLPGLPWDKCRSPWATEYCIDYLNMTFPEMRKACESLNYTALSDGVCYSDGKPYSFWNRSLAASHNKSFRIPTEDYFTNYVQRDASLPENLLHWKLLMCLLIAWLFTFFAAVRRSRRVSKAFYIAIIAPYIFLTIMLTRGLTISGSELGFQFLITTEISSLSSLTLWSDAITQVMFSLSAGTGEALAFASYNRFQYNFIRDAFLVVIVDTLTSFVASVILLCFLGHFAYDTKTPINKIFADGHFIAFFIYPYSAGQMPFSPLWSACFFLMFIITGVDSMYGALETLVSGFVDTWPMLRRWRNLLVFGLCGSLFSLGVPFCTGNQQVWFDLFDGICVEWFIPLIITLECISTTWVYGFSRLKKDFILMTCDEGFCCCGFRNMSYCLALSWMFVIPIVLLSCCSYFFVHPRVHLQSWNMIMAAFIPLIVTTFGIVEVFRHSGNSRKRIMQAASPDSFWGPVSLRFRKLVSHYVKNYTIDPYAERDRRNEDIITMTERFERNQLSSASSDDHRLSHLSVNKLKRKKGEGKFSKLRHPFRRKSSTGTDPKKVNIRSLVVRM